ncbi:MAG: polymerase, sigma-24 subunit, subfamily, partial [Frankiales bacterium]|nr:polymerase, sigma-24 subunit, subfamily [Frankiales bacterium]
FTGQLGDAEQVRELLDSLPPRARAVLVLRYFHDLDDAQIAADLDIRVGTVRSIVSRTLNTLRTRQDAGPPRPISQTKGGAS